VCVPPPRRPRLAEVRPAYQRCLSSSLDQPEHSADQHAVHGCRGRGPRASRCARRRRRSQSQQQQHSRAPRTRWRAARDRRPERWRKLASPPSSRPATRRPRSYQTSERHRSFGSRTVAWADGGGRGCARWTAREHRVSPTAHLDLVGNARGTLLMLKRRELCREVRPCLFLSLSRGARPSRVADSAADRGRLVAGRLEGGLAVPPAFGSSCRGCSPSRPRRSRMLLLLRLLRLRRPRAAARAGPAPATAVDGHAGLRCARFDRGCC